MYLTYLKKKKKKSGASGNHALRGTRHFSGVPAQNA